VSFELCLNSVLVGHIPCDKAICVPQTLTVREVLGKLQAERGDSVVISDGSRILGIFTERDALRMMAVGADLSVPIGSAMTAKPAVAKMGESLANVIQTMAKGGYRRLPIVDAPHGEIRLLKVAHILHYLAEHFPKIVYNLPPMPHQTASVREGA
jgi:signal-transduction protein with cAMP-binding, CBS, and nucleotidyltransferase domain